MTSKSQPDLVRPESDTVWGCEAIGAELGLTATQVRYLWNQTSVLDNAVKKLGHRTIVASRKRLRDVAVPTI
jgi:hypothetical protein